MDTPLPALIRMYVTHGRSVLKTRMKTLPKQDIADALDGLLTMYVNDKNSSTVREFITVTTAGYAHSLEKIGFDGKKKSKEGTEFFCEAKPQNFSTADLESFKKGERRTQPTRLHGGGSFNDYTPSRLEKDIRGNPNILLSGFVDGRLLYIMEIPFAPDIAKTLTRQVKQFFPHGAKPGIYLRGARIAFSDYSQSPKLNVVYVASQSVLKEHQLYINKTLYKFLDGYVQKT